MPDFDDAGVIHGLHVDCLGAGKAGREVQIVSHGQIRSDRRTAGTRPIQRALAVGDLAALPATNPTNAVPASFSRKNTLEARS